MDCPPCCALLTAPWLWTRVDFGACLSHARRDRRVRFLPDYGQKKKADLDKSEHRTAACAVMRLCGKRRCVSCGGSFSMRLLWALRLMGRDSSVGRAAD